MYDYIMHDVQGFLKYSSFVLDQLWPLDKPTQTLTLVSFILTLLDLSGPRRFSDPLTMGTGSASSPQQGSALRAQPI
jgi:hypothetical protein